MALTPGAARSTRMIISAFVAGGIGVGSNLLTAVTSSGQIPKGAVTVALLTGGLLTLKDLQAYLSQPPEALGGVPLPEVHVPPVTMPPPRTPLEPPPHA